MIPLNRALKHHINPIILRVMAWPLPSSFLFSSPLQRPVYWDSTLDYKHLALCRNELVEKINSSQSLQIAWMIAWMRADFLGATPQSRRCVWMTFFVAKGSISLPTSLPDNQTLPADKRPTHADQLDATKARYFFSANQGKSQKR